MSRRFQSESCILIFEKTKVRNITSDHTMAEASTSEDLSGMVNQVLSLFPDASEEWVSSQLRVTRNLYNDHIVDRVCNHMFERAYPRRTNILMDTGDFLQEQMAKTVVNTYNVQVSNSGADVNSVPTEVGDRLNLCNETAEPDSSGDASNSTITQCSGRFSFMSGYATDSKSKRTSSPEKRKLIMNANSICTETSPENDTKRVKVILISDSDSEPEEYNSKQKMGNEHSKDECIEISDDESFSAEDNSNFRDIAFSSNDNSRENIPTSKPPEAENFTQLPPSDCCDLYPMCIHYFDMVDSKVKGKKSSTIFDGDSVYNGEGADIKCETCSTQAPFTKMVPCQDGGHLCCRQCLQKQAQETVFEKKESVSCAKDDCNSIYTKDWLRNVLDKVLMDLLEKMWQRLEIQEIVNIIPGMEKCPVCGFLASLDPHVVMFQCLMDSCGKLSCRYCKKPWSSSNHDTCSLTSALPAASAVSVEIPKHWTGDRAKGYALVSLQFQPNSTNDEYSIVARLFSKSMKNTIIKDIARVENQYMWEAFSLKKKQKLERSGAGALNEKMLFHGTNKKNIEAIVSEQNIDPRLCGTQNGTAFGRGTYFALDANLADRYSSLPIKRLVRGTAGMHQRIIRGPFPHVMSNPASGIFAPVGMPSIARSVSLGRIIVNPMAHIGNSVHNTMMQTFTPSGGQPQNQSLVSQLPTSQQSTIQSVPGQQLQHAVSHSNLHASSQLAPSQPSTSQNTSGQGTSDFARINQLSLERKSIELKQLDLEKRYKEQRLQHLQKCIGMEKNSLEAVQEQSAFTDISLAVFKQRQEYQKKITEIDTEHSDLVIKTALQKMHDQNQRNLPGSSSSTVTSRTGMVTPELEQLGDKVMIVARVLVGRYTLGQPNFSRPPPISEDGVELFDSCVNSMDRPTIFVLFEKNYFYPEYIIRYQQEVDVLR